jgi:hypothetical protein
VDVLAKATAENPNESLLAELRVLEKKMGLVLTLVSQHVAAKKDVVVAWGCVGLLVTQQARPPACRRSSGECGRRNI